MECHGVASLLGDSVEVSSVASVLRGMDGGEKETLIVSSVKTNVGAQCEASAMTSLLKVLFNIIYANNAPTVHLRTLNPHLDVGDGAVVMNTEAMPYRNERAFHGVSSRGMGGTNVNMVCWGMADAGRVPVQKPFLQRANFAYWPAGGGMLEVDAKPHEGYFIAGSWNQWDPEEMERTKDGSFAYTLTLGENGFEVFQIWLDGDRKKVLHPDRQKAAPGSAVLGPSPYAAGSWLLEGRPAGGGQETQAQLGGYASEALALSDGFRSQKASAWARDVGSPGDQYEVKLMISGKYRAVTWKRLPTDPKLSTVMVSGLAQLPPAAIGRYYVTGSMNGWGFTEMTPSSEIPGLFVVEVGPLRGATDFQIIRNKDEQQVFFPVLAGVSTGSVSNEVLGPEFEERRRSWRINGTFGEKVRIEFQRTFVNGQDVKTISWQLV